MAVATWPQFIRQCLLRRVAGLEFQELSRLLMKKQPISGARISLHLLHCRSNICVEGDPLILEYLRALLTSRLVLSSDLLGVMVQTWNKAGRDTRLKITNDASLLNCITEVTASGKMEMPLGEASKLLVLTSRWLSAIARWASQDEMALGARKAPMFIEAIGILLATLVTTEKAAILLTKPEQDTASPSTEPRTSVRKALDLCLPLFSSVSPQLFHRLDTFQKHYDLYDDALASDGSAQKMELNAINFESGVLDVHATCTRAALLVYLDAKLRTSTTIDDSGLLNFLNTRHNGNHETMFAELIIASFQLLANWTSRNEAETAIRKCRQFLLNKAPLLLYSISGSSFGSFSSDASLIAAIAEVGAMTSSSESQKFLHICTLHQLITSEALGSSGIELPVELQTLVLYQKDDIVSQIRGNVQKAAKYVEEISRLDGNSGTVAQALVEVIHAQCLAKETAALKEIVTCVVRKPEVIDTICLYIRPSFVLAPICSLLDAWRWDDLHGESQPVYDEFGSILLFVQAFKHRLEISAWEIGIPPNSSFMAEFFDSKSTETNLNELSDEKQRHLGEWINALFIAEGLTDDLTSSCSPQDFYLLMPTLLNQSMLAHEAGKLTWDTLRSGFEYLLDSFLLPSLVPALLWLSLHAQRNHSQQLIRKILNVLMKAPENPEARSMHHAIIRMTSDPLRHFWHRDASGSVEPKQLPTGLEPFGKFSSKMNPSSTEIQLWTSNPEGPITSTAQAVQNLLYPSTGQPHFTYGLIDYAVQLCGVQPVLEALLQELHQPAETQQYSAGLDIISAIICAGSQPRLSNALRLDHQRLSEVLKHNKSLAETVVRLTRRIDSLIGMTMTAQQELNIDSNLAELDIQNAIANATVAENQQIDLSTIQDQGPDIDAVLDAAAAMGQLPMDQDGNMNVAVGGTQGEGSLDMDDMFGLGDGGGLGQDDMAIFDDLDMDGMF